MKRKYLLPVLFFFVGCAGLKPMCDSADEESLAKDYAAHGTQTQYFDLFANQCAKYGYRVPSKEKFWASYKQTKQFICSETSNYFKASYLAYNSNYYPQDCPGLSPAPFNEQVVRDDAFSAFLAVKDIRRLNDRIFDANLHGKVKYSDDFLLDTVTRALSETNPDTLESNRQEARARLNVITVRYHVSASELGTF